MKRIAGLVIATPILLMVLSFVATQIFLTWKEYPQASAAPDWSQLAAEEIPSLVTLDEDGDRRITQVWIVAHNAQPYLRTGDSQWYANLQRDPNLDLRIGGATYPCATQLVQDPTEAAHVNQAFYSKYPRRSDMFRALGISTDKVLSLTCHYRG